MFTTFNQAVEWIENSHRFGEKLDLVRMNLACEILGHPERTFKSIHVAGTNGKGSTTNFIKNILLEAGYKVGIYTSPYVVSFNERIGINLNYISDEDVVYYANSLKQLWDQVYDEYQDSITFFEILTLMSFLYFRDQKIDIAVVEVGLGGLLDATNVIDPLISLITNISYDHMKQLGNTLESIALNKLGIVKRNRPLVTTEDNPNLRGLFEMTCKAKNAPLVMINPDDISEVKVGQTTETPTVNAAGKVFTQEEVDALINNRFKREREKVEKEIKEKTASLIEKEQILMQENESLKQVLTQKESQ